MSHNASLVYDQSSVQMGAKYVGEEHSVLGNLMRVAARRMHGKVRFIQVNPLALTILQSGSMAVFPLHSLVIDLSNNRAAPSEVGTWDGFPLVVEAFASDECAVVLFGTNGVNETIEIKNASFL
jgi:glycosyltransferase involved in cell wall biosynthesis